jgi:uncharacterized membrane protein
MAAVTAYNVSVWIHVTAVVVGFGATFAEAVMFPVAMQMDERHLPYVHRLGVAINRRLANPALLVIVVTGVYQVAKGDWRFGSFWIVGTLVIAVMLGGLLGSYFIPTDKKLGAMAKRELAAGGLSDEYRRLAKREAQVGTLAGILIVVAIFLMVTKPGA